MEIVLAALVFLGAMQGDALHRIIIDDYNNGPRPQGSYVMTYFDPWCAAYASLCMYNAGVDGPYSVNCQDMINKIDKPLTDNPEIGALVFFDWGGDGVSDHVGVVEDFNFDKIYTIEGNSGRAVRRQQYSRSNNCIMGYAIITDTPAPEIRRPPEIGIGYTGPWVSALQGLLVGWGFDVGSYGIDGDYGNDTAAAVVKFKSENGLDKTTKVDAATWAALVGYRYD